jgi:orotidine-5'-phosphate decarboxylase
VLLAAGAGGLVCAADDLLVIREVAPDLVAVVPGIRPAGAGTDDQARAATPSAAVGNGADVLVIGRPVSRSADPTAAARAIAEELGIS